MSAINNNQTLQALYDEINALKKKNTIALDMYRQLKKEKEAQFCEADDLIKTAGEYIETLEKENKTLKKKNKTLKKKNKTLKKYWDGANEVANAYEGEIKALKEEVKEANEWALECEDDLCLLESTGSSQEEREANEAEIKALKKKNDKIETDYLHACLYAQEDEKKIADLYEQCYQDDEIITQLQDTLGEACEDLVSFGAIRAPEGRSYSL